MRPKKDPTIRREAFVAAATELFVRHGYEGVTIQAVLDAVGDRSASPSVFYYYFSGKDELYRAVIERAASMYVSDYEKAFANAGGPLCEQVATLAEVLRMTLAEYRNVSYASLSSTNRGFILDMKERVTSAMAEMMERSLSQSGLCTDRHVRQLSLFVTGGIAALVMDYLETPCSERGKEREEALVADVIAFSASAIGLDANVTPTPLQKPGT